MPLSKEQEKIERIKSHTDRRIKRFEDGSSWKKRFDEKFADKEGCQAGSVDCGIKVGEADVYLCPTCEKWGGVEGEPKNQRRPLASCEKIKSFIAELLAEERELGYKDGRQAAESDGRERKYALYHEEIVAKTESEVNERWCLKIGKLLSEWGQSEAIFYKDVADLLKEDKV